MTAGYKYVDQCYPKYTGDLLVAACYLARIQEHLPLRWAKIRVPQTCSVQILQNGYGMATRVGKRIGWKVQNMHSVENHRFIGDG